MMTDSNRMDRRRFAGELLAGATLTAGIAATSPALLADDKPVKKDSEAQAKVGDKDDSTGEKPEVPAEVMLLSYLVRQFPSEHFDKEALSGIYRDIRGDVARSKVLQEFPLKNSDEPAFVFRA